MTRSSHSVSAQDDDKLQKLHARFSSKHLAGKASGGVIGAKASASLQHGEAKPSSGSKNDFLSDSFFHRFIEVLSAMHCSVV